MITNTSDTSNGLFGKEEYLEYTNEIHTWVKITESTFAPNPDLFAATTEVSKRDREILIDWLILVQV